MFASQIQDLQSQLAELTNRLRQYEDIQQEFVTVTQAIAQLQEKSDALSPESGEYFRESLLKEIGIREGTPLLNFTARQQIQELERENMELQYRCNNLESEQIGANRAINELHESLGKYELTPDLEEFIATGEPTNFLFDVDTQTMEILLLLDRTPGWLVDSRLQYLWNNSCPTIREKLGDTLAQEYQLTWRKLRGDEGSKEKTIDVLAQEISAAEAEELQVTESNTKKNGEGSNNMRVDSPINREASNPPHFLGVEVSHAEIEPALLERVPDLEDRSTKTKAGSISGDKCVDKLVSGEIAAPVAAAKKPAKKRKSQTKSEPEEPRYIQREVERAIIEEEARGTILPQSNHFFQVGDRVQLPDSATGVIREINFDVKVGRKAVVDCNGESRQCLVSYLEYLGREKTVFVQEVTPLEIGDIVETKQGIVGTITHLNVYGEKWVATVKLPGNVLNQIAIAELKIITKAEKQGEPVAVESEPQEIEEEKFTRVMGIVQEKGDEAVSEVIEFLKNTDSDMMLIRMKELVPAITPGLDTEILSEIDASWHSTWVELREINNESIAPKETEQQKVERLGKQILCKKWVDIREEVKECPGCLRESMLLARTQREKTWVDHLPDAIAQFILTTGDDSDLGWLPGAVKNRVLYSLQEMQKKASG